MKIRTFRLWCHFTIDIKSRLARFSREKFRVRNRTVNKSRVSDLPGGLWTISLAGDRHRRPVSTRSMVTVTESRGTSVVPLAWRIRRNEDVKTRYGRAHNDIVAGFDRYKEKKPENEKKKHIKKIPTPRTNTGIIHRTGEVVVKTFVEPPVALSGATGATVAIPAQFIATTPPPPHAGHRRSRTPNTARRFALRCWLTWYPCESFLFFPRRIFPPISCRTRWHRFLYGGDVCYRKTYSAKSSKTAFPVSTVRNKIVVGNFANLEHVLTTKDEILKCYESLLCFMCVSFQPEYGSTHFQSTTVAIG